MAGWIRQFFCHHRWCRYSDAIQNGWTCSCCGKRVMLSERAIGYAAWPWCRKPISFGTQAFKLKMLATGRMHDAVRAYFAAEGLRPGPQPKRSRALAATDGPDVAETIRREETAFLGLLRRAPQICAKILGTRVPEVADYARLHDEHGLDVEVVAPLYGVEPTSDLHDQVRQAVALRQKG